MEVVQELRVTLWQIAQVLDALSVPWAVGGSFASTVHGEPRSSNDLDIIASLRSPHIALFIQGLGDHFYTDEASIREAIDSRDSFNVIDERWFMKVDVFVPRTGPLGEGQLDRRRAYTFSEGSPTVFVLGPEDTILQKLRWFELGGRVSDRQWRDLTSVVRLGGTLDRAYLRSTAEIGGLSELLESALAEGQP